MGLTGVPLSTKDDGHGHRDDADGAQSSTRDDADAGGAQPSARDDADAGGAKLRLGDKEFHIAPMIDVSTIEFRYFIRLLTKRAIIWNQVSRCYR